MNSVPDGERIYDADDRDQLRMLLLDETVGRYGQGNWTWQVTADQADPDLFDELDPDEGNDWQRPWQEWLPVLLIHHHQ